jgi:folate-binding protein YgfZ
MARTVLRIGGADRVHFLQGLVTNDLKHLASGLVYAAILTPQGKYLADFLLRDEGDAILLDADAAQAPGLAQRLAMYRLRAAVTIADSGLHVRRGTGPAPEGALPDPRHPALGWRLYGAEDGDDATDFDAIRVAHCIPESGIELIPNDTFILEAGFERLHGVDYRKGCYVGQEVTARMKHKTDLRKGLATVEVEGSAPIGTPLLTADGKEAGTLYSQSQGRGIAYLRFDRADAALTAGPATVRLAPQAAAS